MSLDDGDTLAALVRVPPEEDTEEGAVGEGPTATPEEQS